MNYTIERQKYWRLSPDVNRLAEENFCGYGYAKSVVLAFTKEGKIPVDDKDKLVFEPNMVRTPGSDVSQDKEIHQETGYIMAYIEGDSLTYAKMTAIPRG